MELLDRFVLNIDTRNDAFGPTHEDMAGETARILRVIADRLDSVLENNYTDKHGGWIGHYQTILDTNGNDVGRYAFKPKGRI